MNGQPLSKPRLEAIDTACRVLFESDPVTAFLICRLNRLIDEEWYGGQMEMSRHDQLLPLVVDMEETLTSNKEARHRGLPDILKKAKEIFPWLP